MANIVATNVPREGDLLWLQTRHEHRSYTIFTNAQADSKVKARRCDRDFWFHIRDNLIHPRVYHYISEAGFAGVINTGYHKLDHALIQALVERWRPETHTFHLPVGEAAVTLKDVQILWGLPIDGPAVCGLWQTMSNDQWILQGVLHLGIVLEPAQVKHGKVSIGVLTRHLSDPLPQDEIAYEQRARLYLLILLGGHLFSDGSSTEVSLNLLQHLVDLTREGRRSWATAVLAVLYRNLCTCASNIGNKGLNGPLVLLQIWAWDRMPCIAPTCQNAGYQYQFPLAARYSKVHYNKLG